VSNDVGVDITVRAFVECPECIARTRPDRNRAVAFASSWCEKYGWNPDVIETFAEALIEWCGATGTEKEHLSKKPVSRESTELINKKLEEKL
jgi:hypothetical protein